MKTVKDAAKILNLIEIEVNNSGRANEIISGIDLIIKEYMPNMRDGLVKLLASSVFLDEIMQKQTLMASSFIEKDLDSIPDEINDLIIRDIKKGDAAIRYIYHYLIMLQCEEADLCTASNSLRDEYLKGRKES